MYWFVSRGDTGLEIMEITPLTKPCTCDTMCEQKETKRGEGPGLTE